MHTQFNFHLTYNVLAFHILFKCKVRPAALSDRVNKKLLILSKSKTHFSLDVAKPGRYIELHSKAYQDHSISGDFSSLGN